jgi:hypothetical protein
VTGKAAATAQGPLQCRTDREPVEWSNSTRRARAITDAIHDLRRTVPERLLAFAWRASQAGAPRTEKEIAYRFGLWCWPGAGPVLALHIISACLILAKRLFSLVQLGRLELPTS